MEEANISYFPPVFHMSDVIMASPEAAMHWKKDLSQLHLFSSTSWLQHSWRFVFKRRIHLPFHLWSSITIESPVWRQRRRHYLGCERAGTTEKSFHTSGVMRMWNWPQLPNIPGELYPSGSGSKLQVHVLDQLLMLKCCRSQMSLGCPQQVTDYSRTEELFEICHGPHLLRIIVLCRWDKVSATKQT